MQMMETEAGHLIRMHAWQPWKEESEKIAATRHASHQEGENLHQLLRRYGLVSPCELLQTLDIRSMPVAVADTVREQGQSPKPVQCVCHIAAHNLNIAIHNCF